MSEHPDTELGREEAFRRLRAGLGSVADHAALLDEAQDDRARRSMLLALVASATELRDRAADAYEAMDRERDQRAPDAGWWRHRMRRRRCRVIAGVAAPPDLTVALPSPRMTGTGEQSLADDMSKIVGFWVAAWATGDVSNPRYAGYCIMQRRFFLDETVTLWSRAKIRPAGQLRVYNLTGNTSYGGYNGVAVMCVDDAGLYAVNSSGRAGDDPFHLGEPVLFVLSGVYDTAVNHWIMTAGELFPGGAYCGRSGTPAASPR